MGKYFLAQLAGLIICFAGAFAQPADPSAAAAGGAASISEAEVERLAQEIHETTMSPYCPGRTLQACPSGQALELRNKIRQWLKQGYTKAGVRNQLLTIYGEDIRGTPREKGFGLMAWIAPALFVLIFALLVILSLRRMRARAEAAGDPAPEGAAARMPVDSAALEQAEEQIEAELAQRLK